MNVQKLTQKRVYELIRTGVPGEHRDAAARGLILRVRSPSSHSWSVRRHLYGKNNRLDLGDDWSLDEARDLAGEVERRVKAGCDPFWRDVPGWEEHFRHAKLKKHGIDPSALVDPLEPPPNAGRRVPDGPAMTWSDALDLWLAHLATIRRQDTVRSYRGAMRIAEMRAFEDEWVSEVRIEALAEAIDAIHRRGAERQARFTTICVRLFFKWLGAAGQRSKTGVAQHAMKELETPEYTNRHLKAANTNRARARIPSGPEIGVIARGLRCAESATSERDRLAGLLVLYSCQRRRTVATAERAQFESCGALGGLWKIPPSHRKTADEKARRGLAVGDHIVPLPPQSWIVVKRAIALAGDSPFLFPSTRQRRAGQVSLHADPTSITHAYGAIPGNLCSPHDVRRAFGTTYRKDAGFALDAVKTILDHNEGIASGDVTASHYSFLDGTDAKWPLMRGWAEFVDKWAATRD